MENVAIVIFAIVVVTRIITFRRGRIFRISGSETRGFALALGLRVVLGAYVLAVSAPASYAPWAAIGSMFVPSLLLSRVIVPFRSPRLAYVFTWLTLPFSVAADVRGGAALMGLLALGRKRDAELPDHLERNLMDATRARARGPTLAAFGLAAGLRGDSDTARALFHVVASMRWTQCPRWLRVFAKERLVADSATCGRWLDVVGLERRGPGSRWGSVVGRAARLITGSATRVDRWLLWPSWLLAPRRLATWSLVIRAARSAPEGVAPERVAPGEAPLADANRRLAQLLRAPLGAPFADRVTRVAASWDRALEAAETRAHVERRMLALGATVSPASVLDELASDVAATLARLIDDSGVAVAPESGVAARAVERLRQRYLYEIESDRDVHFEAGAVAWQTLDPVERWTAWARFRRAAERLVAIDPSSAGLLFRLVNAELTNVGAKAHNQDKQYPLANDIFRWLLARSEHALSPETPRLLARNVKIGRFL